MSWSVGDFVSLADPETFARAWVGTVTRVQPAIERVVVRWDHEACERLDEAAAHAGLDREHRVGAC